MFRGAFGIEAQDVLKMTSKTPYAHVGNPPNHVFPRYGPGWQVVFRWRSRGPAALPHVAEDPAVDEAVVDQDLHVLHPARRCLSVVPHRQQRYGHGRVEDHLRSVGLHRGMTPGKANNPRQPEMALTTAELRSTRRARVHLDAVAHRRLAGLLESIQHLPPRLGAQMELTKRSSRSSSRPLYAPACRFVHSPQTTLHPRTPPATP